MGTVYCCHCCLLWFTLSVFQQVSGSLRECPQGMLLHTGGNLLHTGPSGATCCFPTRCGVGEQVMPCTVNRTQDICEACGSNQNQSLRTSSYTMDRCTDWPLDKRCKNIVVNPGKHTWDEQAKRCACNIELGNHFEAPESENPAAPLDSYCQRRDDPCKPGYEPHVDGGCTPCRKHYFKSTEGFTLCEPITNCTMLGLNFTDQSTPTADSNCSQPDLVTTMKPQTPDKPDSIVLTPPTEPVISSQSSIMTSGATTNQHNVVISTSGDMEDTAEHIWPIVGSTLFLVVLVTFIGIIMFWRRRKGKSVCLCTFLQCCVDLEKNHVPEPTSQLVNQQSRHTTSNGYTSHQQVASGDKFINNNVVDGVPCNMDSLPNGHPNGGVPHVHFYKSENGNCKYSKSCPQKLTPAHPRGILRNVKQVVFQRQGSTPDGSDQEELQVHLGEFEANPSTGETDHLLVSEHLHRTVPHQIQNPSSSVCKSPPVIQAGMRFPFSSSARTNFDQQIFVEGMACPPFHCHGSPADDAVAAGTLFTRSASVIASPEGEVDEDEKQDYMPRFSQLLQDDEDTLAPDQTPSHKNHVDFQGDSYKKTPHQPVQHQTSSDKPTNQQNHHQSEQTSQKRPGVAPKPAFQGVHQTNQPRHHIMNLKEQQLTETNTQLKTALDFTEPETVSKNAAPEEVQETEPKTLLSPVMNDLNTPDVKNPEMLGRDRAGGNETGDGVFQNLADRRRHISGGSTGQNTQDRKRAPPPKNKGKILPDRNQIPSGGSGSSAQNALDHRSTLDDQQRLYVRASSSEARETTSKGENPLTSSKQQGLERQSLQAARSQNSSERTDNDFQYKGLVVAMSGNEQKNIPESSSSGNKHRRRNISRNSNASSCSSKISGSSDLSDTEASNRNTVYRRSQSQNTSSSIEPTHKLPPRSMSEEKPQKLDKPVAKVKPMTAGDTHLSGDMDVLPQAQASATDPTILNSGNDDSGQEQDLNVDQLLSSAVEEEIVTQDEQEENEV